MNKLLVFLIFINFACNRQLHEAMPEQSIVYPVVLLQDDSLEAFEKKGGTAEYFVKDGILTGVADKDIPNTFLTTKKQYDDFALSFKVKVDPRLNSGVQIRSLPDMDENGYEMLKGYQVEIDPSERAWSGGIYEERGRGWIANLADNPKGRAAFKSGEWNDYFIILQGNHIQVTVNGVGTTNLLDSVGTKGHIGFQVHAIYDDAHVGAQVQWKDILFYPDLKFSRRMNDEEKAIEKNLLVNKLSEYEKEEGWQLFDLRRSPMPQDELRNWNLEENCLCAQGQNMADLVIPRPGIEFEFKFEYTIEKGGTALFNYEQDPNGEDTSSFVLADDSNLDAATPKDEMAGSLYGVHSAKNLSNPDRAKALRWHDQWSQVRVVLTNERLQHWLNHNLVLEMNADFAFDTEYKRFFKFKNEGSRVCVRSIKYRSLDD